MAHGLVPAILIILGGAAIALQAPINGALGRSLTSPVAAAAVSFGVGFAALAFLTLVGGSGAFMRLGAPPAWQFAGGLLGAFYVWAMVAGVGSLGVVTAMAALVFGQLSAALILDWTGTFGLAAQPISLTRILSVVLVGAGLVLSRL